MENLWKVWNKPCELRRIGSCFSTFSARFCTSFNVLHRVFNIRYNTNTNNQLKTVQKIEHNLVYMDYAKIFYLQFYWLLVLIIFFLIRPDSNVKIAVGSNVYAIVIAVTLRLSKQQARQPACRANCAVLPKLPT